MSTPRSEVAKRASGQDATARAASGWQTSSLPARPLLTTPRRLLRQELIDLERERLAGQPQLGLVGLVFVAAAFFVLAFGAGDVESSLVVLGPLSAFALPVIAVIAFWWEDWPGSSLRPGWSGLADTFLVIVAAVVLTIAAQALAGRVDLCGVFDAQPGAGHLTTFPATLPLAGAAFGAMLQLSLVCEGWPLRRLGRLCSGLAALAVSELVAVAAYWLLVNIDAVPADVRAATGWRNPGGPVDAADFGGWLVTVGFWQALFFIALRGWPFNSLRRRSLRLLSGNAAVLGAGSLTYVALKELAHWQPATIGAAGGCVIASTLIVAVLFEGWPASRLTPWSGRLVTLALIVLVAVALNRSLAAYAERVEWTKASAEDWVTFAAATYIGAGVILHVAVGRRWPLVATPSGDRRG